MTRKTTLIKPAGPFRRAAIELLPDTYETVLGHAQRRNMTLGDFLARVVETMIEEDLVGTLLGDEEEAQG